MLRSLYRLVPEKYVSTILQEGLHPTREMIKGVFMFSIKDLKYWNNCQIKGDYTNIPNLLDALIAQVKGEGHEELALLKINLRGLKADKLRIREQSLLLDDTHAIRNFTNNLKIEQGIFNNFLNRFLKHNPNCSMEEATEIVKESYPSLLRRHIEKVGEPSKNAVIYTNNKKAIEYIYTENIPNSAIEVVGTSSAKTTTKEIFQELTAGKPEAKHLWQI